MEENLGTYDSEVTDVNENYLIKKIWFKPTNTLEFIIKYCPNKFVTPLLILGGIGRAIDRASVKDMGDSMPTLGILALALIAGGLFGWITYYIYAWSMSVTGKWINGQAEPAEFRTVIAWSLIPAICSLMLMVPKVIIFGDDLFKSNPTNTSLFNSTLWIIFGTIEIVLSIWTLVILIKGTSILQGFKTGKSFLNIILPALVIIVPIATIVLLVKLIN